MKPSRRGLTAYGPRSNDESEAIEQPVAFGALAAQQCDLLAVFTYAHEVEAEVCFVALLHEVEADQRAADADDGEHHDADRGHEAEKIAAGARDDN